LNFVTVAARNTLRNKLRTALTVLAVATAVIAFVMLRTVLASWNVGVDYAAKDRISTRNKVSLALPLPKKYIDVVRAVSGVKQTCYANWFAGKNPKDESFFFASIAIDASCLDVFDEVVVDPAERQAWLADRQGAILGELLAKKLGVKVGDRVTLTGTIYPGDWQFDVSGIYRATRKSFDRSQLMFHWDYLNDSIPERRRDQIGWITTRVDDPSRGPAICAEIDRTFDERDVQTMTMTERAASLSSLATLSAVLTTIDIISAAILVIMMMILGNTIAMGVRERTREYGALRAIGFGPLHIAAFVLGEAIMIGLVSSVVGAALSYPIVELGMGRFLEENVATLFPYFQIEPSTLAAATLLAVGLSVAAALPPAYQASKLSVVEALRFVA
jgi:putative ABC transport system permease protein